MRNLEATSCVVLPTNTLLSEAHCFCLDCDSGSVWVATDSALCCITADGQVTAVVPLVEGGHMSRGDTAVGVEYISDLESVCLALRGGDLLLCNVHTHQVECMGSVSAGVCCMAWSPDQELVVLASGQGKLLMMTRDFDPISETALHPEEFGEAKPVTVGWGKKATQFHGSLGKPTAKTLKTESHGPALPWDDGRPQVSWRGDGEFFACTTVDPTSGRPLHWSRRVRVWTRDCQLHSTSEVVEGLEQALHWRPCGNVLACSQRKPHQHDIIFLEKNGLWHGQFALPFDPLAVQVLEVQWSSDSAVLALWLQDLSQGVYTDSSAKEGGEGGTGGLLPRTFIQLWCMGNYHWYLKQELHLTPPPSHTHSAALAGLLWDPIVPLRLHLLTRAGQYMCYNWRRGIAESKTHSQDNMASLVVIDGARLLLTPFRYTVIPPPMCAHEVLLPSPVLQVTFAPPPQCNDFVVLLASGQLAVFSGPTVNKDPSGGRGPPCAPQLLGRARPAIDSAEAVLGLHSLRQLCWWQPDCLLGVVWDVQRHSDIIVELSVQLDPKAEFVQCRSTLCPLPLLCLCCNPDSGSVAVQLVDGSVLSYSHGLLQPWDGSGLRFPDQPCEQIALATFGGKECVVGLNSFRRALYIDTERLATDCTSFAVHNEFLLLSTDSHTLRCVSLHTHPSELTPLTTDKPHPLDESVRRVERGSRIVAVVTHDVRVILQMPRGNLETVCPRALVLCSIRCSLDHREFHQAFHTMRKHRINLNLMYDHNPQVFLSHMKEFVEQLESVNYINLFLTELREEDVTETMYPRVGMDVGARQGGREGNKVDRVCDAMRQALVDMGESKYMLSIITAHVKKSRPELETVLEKVKHLKEHPPPSTPHAVTAEEALRYSLFLVDVNELFDVALGTYDFSLVLMVAEKSQKDPKEYLPFLNELRQLPKSYQRYRIDKFLRRYSRALKNISQCPDRFEECLQLVCEHSLFAEALSIFSDRASDQHKVIARAYGEHLTESGQHREAGIILAQCGCLQEALAAYEKASCWQQVFALSAQLKHSTADRVALARRVAGSLKAQKCHTAAAIVLQDYAKDVEEAEVALLEGGLWKEAERIAYLHGRADLIETHLRPGLLEAQQAQLALSEALQSSFTRHVSRLAVVREEKQRKHEAMLDGTYAADEKEADLFSETSSVTGHSTMSTHSSMASKTSGRSSKNRRKSERKKHSLREGSAFEDVALLESIREIVGTVDRLQEEVGSLLGTLVQHGFSGEASRLQAGFGGLVDCVRQGTASVWQPTASDAHTLQEVAGPGSTANSIIAAMAASRSSHMANKPSTMATAPKLRDTVQWKLEHLSLAC